MADARIQFKGCTSGPNSAIPIPLHLERLRCAINAGMERPIAPQIGELCTNVFCVLSQVNP